MTLGTKFVAVVAMATTLLAFLSRGSSLVVSATGGFQDELRSSTLPNNNRAVESGKHGLSVTWESDSNQRMGSGSGVGSSNRDDSTVTKDDASFEGYLKMVGKRYDSEDEFARRKAIYESNLESIRAHNANAHHHGWTMGVNQFADLLPHELPKGFDKGLPHGPGSHESLSDSSSRLFSSVVHEQSSKSKSKPSSNTHTAGEPQSPAEASSLRSRNLRTASLPESVDWRAHDFPIVTPIKDQGRCGSCWAFAATAVLESHVALATHELFSLSPQALVSCAPNPDHCGGTGGCEGSTGELAYDYVAKHGMVSEWSYGYTSYHGKSGTCELKESYDGYVAGAQVALVGYSSLPTNSYDALMYAVATMGPVVVSVAASNWGLYRSGIFDDFDKTEHYDINHAVVLEGYGTDAETGQDYWLVRNSWGVLWGENGYIRLKRTDPTGFFFSRDRYEEKHCKMDVTPSHGVACEGPDGNATIPDQLVCGTSGILYASVVPVGAHLVGRIF
jgi:cathepsin L